MTSLELEQPPDIEQTFTIEQLKAWEWGMLALTPNEVEKALQLQREIATRLTESAVELRSAV